MTVKHALYFYYFLKVQYLIAFLTRNKLSQNSVQTSEKAS